MFRKGRRWMLALLVLLGCGDKTEVKIADEAPASEVRDPGKPVTGDWLVLHELSDPEQLNPLTSNDAGSADVLGYIFESLLGRDPKSLELIPAIAEARPEISGDKRAYTFKIRRDARFQDGRPVTGEDVLFSAKAIKCPLVNAPFLRVYFDSLIDAQLLDPYTIRFVIKEPYFLNESVLGGITIMPRHYYDPENWLGNVTMTDLLRDPTKLGEPVEKFADHFNKSYNRNPMGSGPYKFNLWKTGQEVELVRDPRYWGNGKAGIDQPYLDRLKFRIVNNYDAALIRLKSGEIDFMERLEPVQHIRGTSSERFKRQFKKYEYFAPTYTYIGWNNDHPIFSDKRVRRAMTYFTDRKQMVKTILFGLGEVVESPIYFFRPEYDRNLASFPFAPQKGLELLKEAGWSDTDGDGVLDKVIDGKKVSLRFEIKINSGNATRKSIALILQDQLRKYGVYASVRELDWTIFLNDIKNHHFDAMIGGWQMPVSESDAFQVWHSSQAANKGSNQISYKNKRVDEILEQYRHEFDSTKRIQLYREFQEILSDEQPYTFLFIQKWVSPVQRRFENVRVLPAGLRPIEWWVAATNRKYASQMIAN
jgi:peptide/nickel transport system substrate-binding protein